MNKDSYSPVARQRLIPMLSSIKRQRLMPMSS